MRRIYFFLISMCFFFYHCNGGAESGGEKSASQPNPDQKNEYGLTDFEMNYGIGPIKKRLFLPQINKAFVNKGEQVFKMKCAPCHKLDERYIGPAQRYATERRPPEYIMNMMLNPDEMVKRHPEAKKLLAEYLSPMTNQNVTEEDARNVLEYLRFAAQEGREKNIPEIPVFKNQTK